MVKSKGLDSLVKFLSIFLLTIVSMQSLAGTPLKLNLAGPKFAPYYYADADGKPSGELVRLYALIVEHAGFGWDGAIIPAKRVMKALTDGMYDSSILVKNPLLEASGTILSSPVPVSEMILNLYSHQVQKQSLTKESLLGKKVVVMRGYGYGGLRSWLDHNQDKLVMIEVDSFSSAIRMLEANRADYALLYDVNFAAGEKELGRSAKAVNSYTLERVPLYFHINSQQIPNAQQVMNQLMASYQSLVSLGVLAAASNLPDQVVKASGVQPQ